MAIKRNDIIKWVIYKIKSPTGRIYIGKSSNFQRRMYAYKHSSQPQQKHLYNSFKKHGFDAHTVEIIEEFMGTLSESGSKEMFWIRTYMCNYAKWPEMNGMNLTDGGEGLIGVIVTEETRQKMKEWHRQNPRKNMLGRKMSEESRRKQSEKKKGKPAHNKGKTMPAHQLANLIKINTGKPSWNKGKKFGGTEEERKQKFGFHNIGNSYNKGRKQSAEIIAARVAKQTGKSLIKKWKPVLQYDLQGNLINEHPSLKDTVSKTKLSRSHIRKIINGEVKKPQFIFKYKVA